MVQLFNNKGKIMIKLIPIITEHNKEYFVSTDLLKPKLVPVGTVDVMTQPLVFNKAFNLLNISQRSGLLENGTVDPTDTLGPVISIKNIYFNIGGEIKKTVIHDPLLIFTSDDVHGYRNLNLNVSIVSFTIPNFKDTGIDLYIYFSIEGTINTQTGNCSIYANYTGANSSKLPSDELALLLRSATLVGYDLDAERVSYNYKPTSNITSAFDILSIKERARQAYAIINNEGSIAIIKNCEKDSFTCMNPNTLAVHLFRYDEVDLNVESFYKLTKI